MPAAFPATEFIGDYSAFLGKIRVAYPAATIVCLDGPMLSGDELSTCQHYIKRAVLIAEKNGDSNIFTFSLSTGAKWFRCRLASERCTTWHAQMTSRFFKSGR
ncbi:MAG: hypothetical protein R3C26_25695 [Calditrichia bacterium]